MRSLDLILTLRDDLVASASPATEGGHESLDFIPGAMLLGAAAARIYREVSRAEAYALFHSGRVRFGDGLPIGPDGAPIFPMPLCWHEKKGESAMVGERIDSKKVCNFQHGRFPNEDQPKQMRDDHVGLDGRVLSVKKALRMKTAIDPQTGRIREAQLFGYEAICAGERFRARVEADDDLPDPLWQRLLAVFTGGDLLLGRSRSAEYGRVRVETASAAPARLPTTDSSGETLTLWCLSDLALIDENGQPTLEPTPDRLGLGKGKVDWPKSFLRFRSYAPWNAYRRAYDLERQVIRRGSVITLHLEEAPTARELAELGAGTGLWREAGLGRLWVNPPLLSEAHPPFAEPTATDEPTAPTASRPDHPLIRWLEAQQAGGASRRQAEERARNLEQELARRYRLARTYAGLPDGTPVGPSPSQWGSVLAKAKEWGDREALRRALFEEANAVCKPKGEGWQDAFRDAEGVRSFYAWFQEELPTDLDAIRAFARRGMELARREHGRGTKKEKRA